MVTFVDFQGSPGQYDYTVVWTTEARLVIIMLQIFAIILFSNSLLLFSQFSAIILIILRLKELSLLVSELEQATLELEVKHRHDANTCTPAT